MSDPTIEITINGDAATIDAGTTVAEVVESRVESTRGVAVARNLEMVPRSTWGDIVVVTGDEIEILAAAQGG